MEFLRSQPGMGLLAKPQSAKRKTIE